MKAMDITDFYHTYAINPPSFVFAGYSVVALRKVTNEVMFLSPALLFSKGPAILNDTNTLNICCLKYKMLKKKGIRSK